jgi:peroxiredoxin
LEAVYEKYRKQGLVIIGVNFTQDEEPPARAFAERYKLTFPVGHDTSGEITSLYVVQAAPMISFVDKTGKLVESHIGELTEAAFRQRINDLLAS